MFYNIDHLEQLKNPKYENGLFFLARFFKEKKEMSGSKAVMDLIGNGDSEEGWVLLTGR